MHSAKRLFNQKKNNNNSNKKKKKKTLVIFSTVTLYVKADFSLNTRMWRKVRNWNNGCWTVRGTIIAEENCKSDYQKKNIYIYISATILLFFKI